MRSWRPRLSRIADRPGFASERGFPATSGTPFRDLPGARGASGSPAPAFRGGRGAPVSIGARKKPETERSREPFRGTRRIVHGSFKALRAIPFMRTVETQRAPQESCTCSASPPSTLTGAISATYYAQRPHERTVRRTATDCSTRPHPILGAVGTIRNRARGSRRRRPPLADGQNRPRNYRPHSQSTALVDSAQRALNRHRRAHQGLRTVHHRADSDRHPTTPAC